MNTTLLRRGGGPIHKFISQLLLVNMLRFKYQQNLKINENFDLWRGPERDRVTRFQKFEKTLL